MSLKDAVKKRKDKRITKRLLPYLQEEIMKPFPGYSTKRMVSSSKKLLEEIKTTKNGDVIATHILDLLFNMLSGERKGRECLHPSELKDACKRKLYYDLSESAITNPKRSDITPKLQLIFDIGHLLHAYVQYKLFKMGVLKESEADVDDEELMIGGKTDGIIVFKEDPLDEYVLEIKTINDNGFRKLKGSPMEKHIDQASTYGGVLRRQGRPIKGILFIYINKNTSEIKEYLVPIDEVMFKATEDKCTEVVEALKTKVAPKQECFDEIEGCSISCPYSKLCFS